MNNEQKLSLLNEFLNGYSVEKQLIRNQKMVKCKTMNRNSYTGKIYEVRECENFFTSEEKIEIIDKLYNEAMTKFINILEQFEKDKEFLPKKEYGEIKLNSLKAWAKKHNTDDLLYFKYSDDITLKIGNIYIDDVTIYSDVNKCPDYRGDKLIWTGDYHLVNHVFHKIISKLEEQENVYFREHDATCLKIKELKEIQVGNICFGNKELNDILFNKTTDTSIERIEEFIDAFKELRECIDNISKRLSK